MKNKIYIAAFILCFAALVSCGGSDSKDYVDKSIIPAGYDSTGGQTNSTAVNAGNGEAIPGNAVVIPGTNTPVSLGQQPGQAINFNPQNTVINPGQQVATQATASGLNPAHGQPGHRCDISVGEPLNSKPASAAPASINTASAQPAVTMTEVPTPNKPTAPGMNPPHGEPGHRCDISVGEPLNSKPPPPASVVSTTPPPTTTTISTPQPVATKTAPGMNPPHGEPGHRCEIAVGAPLNSKPAATAAPAKAATPPPLLTPPTAKPGGK